MFKLNLTLILFVAAFAVSAFGQFDERGALNEWTVSTLARNNRDSKETAYLKEVRAAKNEGFDRVVFEFTGDLPAFQIEYTKPPITGTADEEIKLSGKYFILITLHRLPYPEDEKLAKAKIPKGKLNLPILSELREIEWFEGDRPFAVGLSQKKQFRVLQLKNPTRLVVDFKH